MPEFYHYAKEDDESDGQGDQSVVENENQIHLRFTERYETFMEGLRNRKNGQEITQEDIAVINKRLKGLDNLDKYIEKHYSSESDRTLYDRQMNIFEGLREFLERGETDGYIKLPTGGGKTVIFTEFLEAFDQKTLIVVPTKLLVDQTDKKIGQFAPDIEVGKIYQYAKDHNKQVTVTTYQSLVSGVGTGDIHPEDYDCLILDEVHEALSEKRSEIVQKFTKAIKLGFTATPEYSRKKNVENLLGNEIYNMTIKEAAEEGMISPFSVLIAKTEADLSNVAVAKSGEYDEKELEKAINIESRNKAAVQLYTEMFSDKKAVLYAINVEHAKKMVEMFERAGVSAAIISAKTSESERKDILKKYASGEISVLCNVGVLTRGFDEPSASVCLNLRPTLSPVAAEQRGGRVLRQDPADPDKFAYIVEFLDKNTNKKHLPITFADVAGGATVTGPVADGRLRAPRDRENITAAAKQIKIEGLQVVVETAEVMRVIQEMQQQKYENAPEGWSTISAVAKELKTSFLSIRSITDEYRKTNSDWFKFFLNNNIQPFEFINPDLIKIVKEEYLNMRDLGYAPEGWETAYSIATRFGIGRKTVELKVEKYKEIDREYVKKYLNRLNQPAEYIAPELVKIIEGEIVSIQNSRKQLESPLPGWDTLGSMANRIGIRAGALRKIAKEYRLTNPKWFRTFLNEKNKRPFEYISHELVVILEQRAEEILGQRNNFEQVPPGWKTIADLSKELQKKPKTIKREIDAVIVGHSEWKKTFLNPHHRAFEYYHPDLVEILMNKFKK